MRILGIDEAGRGCVLGSLIIAGFILDDADPETLREAGADDSKRLSVKQRRAALQNLIPLGTSDVRAVTAEQIDTGNLNQLEEAVIVDLVRTWKPDRVEIDALGPPSAIPRVIARLQAEVGDACRPEWVMEPKADQTYPVVGAASIFAKTTRDDQLAEHAAEAGALGSGYPSDPTTRAWLTQWARTGQPWPPFVRTRWQTVIDLAQQDLFG